MFLLISWVVHGFVMYCNRNCMITILLKELTKTNTHQRFNIGMRVWERMEDSLERRMVGLLSFPTEEV